MNKTIKELNAKLESLQGDSAEIESQLQKAWNEVFKDIKSLDKAVKNLGQASEYQWDKYGEIEVWFRWNDIANFEDCKPYFEEYMRDNHCISVDWDNSCLNMSVGPSIVINDDGDVYDQDGDKFFIKKQDYTTEDGDLDEDKRNELIEAYMEKNGYYPGVFTSDRHGNIFAVKTQKRQSNDK